MPGHVHSLALHRDLRNPAASPPRCSTSDPAGVQPQERVQMLPAPAVERELPSLPAAAGAPAPVNHASIRSISSADRFNPWSRHRAATKLRKRLANRLAEAPCSNQGSCSLTTSTTKRTSSRRISTPRSRALVAMLVRVCAPSKPRSLISCAIASNRARYSGGDRGGAWLAS